MRVKFFCLTAFCFALAALCAVCPTPSVYAINYESFFDVSLGYRRDEVFSQSIAYEAGDVPVTRTTVHITDIPVIQGGLLLGAVFADDWVFLADLNLGKVLGGPGRYKEKTISFGGDVIKAEVYEGHTGDANISAGYCPLFWSWFRVGPLVGWSYHTLTAEMHKVAISANRRFPQHRVRFKNSWQGPWVGASVSTLVGQLTLYGEYEYHWPHYNASWVPLEGDLFAASFADQRKGSGGNGQVGLIGAVFPVYCGWNLGFEGKYQYWTVNQGSNRPKSGSFAQVGTPDIEHEKLIEAYWQSWQGRVALFYQF